MLARTHSFQEVIPSPADTRSTAHITDESQFVENLEKQGFMHCAEGTAFRRTNIMRVRRMERHKLVAGVIHGTKSCAASAGKSRKKHYVTKLHCHNNWSHFEIIDWQSVTRLNGFTVMNLDSKLPHMTFFNSLSVFDDS